jgi:hypothetical protein
MKIYKLLHILIIIFLSASVSAQDIYDLTHSKKYANYLYLSQEYSLAAKEFERITFLDRNDTLARLQLLHCYRILKEYKTGLYRGRQIIRSYDNPPEYLAFEYGRLLILNDSVQELAEFLNQNSSLPANAKEILSIGGMLYTGDYHKASLSLEEMSDMSSPFMPDYQKIITAYDNFTFRKPATGMLLSALVPGLGKVYSGDWKDAIIAMLFTGTSAWQAYRGFHKNGVQSAYGWIFGGLTAGFYIGNIYGSGKAVHKRNNEFKHKLHHQVEEAVNRHNMD